MILRSLPGIFPELIVCKYTFVLVLRCRSWMHVKGQFVKKPLRIEHQKKRFMDSYGMVILWLFKFCNIFGYCINSGSVHLILISILECMKNTVTSAVFKCTIKTQFNVLSSDTWCWITHLHRQLSRCLGKLDTVNWEAKS